MLLKDLLTIFINSNVKINVWDYKMKLTMHKFF